MVRNGKSQFLSSRVLPEEFKTHPDVNPKHRSVFFGTPCTYIYEMIREGFKFKKVKNDGIFHVGPEV